jgi:hypothetical protein
MHVHAPPLGDLTLCLTDVKFRMLTFLVFV